ncbi:NYN domain-containing protein [Tepidibacter sp. Z1-5]|uniref:NYN domain-containing protein n=1 Tax=Tepidibacter sp. Z1-5 TaxID=3134138 RepID=UPI0030BBAAA2
MREYLILDGYNIINAWKELKELANESLEIARQKLAEIMVEHASYNGIKVIIVFDAYLVKGSRNVFKEYENLEVVYTKENQTADSYIEKLISQMNKRDIIKVATNDWAEQQIILGKGAIRISARELRLEVDFAKSKILKKTLQKKTKKNTLDSLIDEETLSKLEKIRRNR